MYRKQLARLSTAGLFALITPFLVLSNVEAQDIPDPTQPTNWSDSYSVNGQCYCDTNFDHGLSSVSVETNNGRIPVTEICATIRSSLGSGPEQGRLYFNTVQCGHGPVNTAADETVCPGIPRGSSDFTGNRCFETGATWNLDRLFPAASLPVETPEAPETAPEPAPVEDPAPDPVPEPVEAPAPDPVPEPVEAPAPDPVPEPVESPVTNPVPEPIETPVTEPEPEPVEVPELPTTVPTFDICSSDATDPDGDGFGFENGQTCLTNNDTGSAPSTPADPAPTTPATPVFATCSSSATDPDGDGFGFENGQTCLTNNDSGTAPSTPEDPAPSTPAFAACASSETDPDGDGFGFENGQTCLTNNDSGPAPSTPEDPAPSTPAFAACASNETDPDGDGFGFENGQTCLVNTDSESVAAISNTPTFDICSADVADPDGDGFGFENGQSCLIDTDTDSTPTPEASTRLQAANQPFDSCGTTTPNESFNSATDLVVLHFDFALDPADGHAVVADKGLLDHFAIQNYWVVAGTNSRWQNNFIDTTDILMDSLFGQGGWQKAIILNDTTWTQAMIASAQRWSETLGNGGDVWIAEGGPADFTSAVLRSIESTVNSCDWQARIHVIQHSVTNETNTGRLQNDQRTNDLAYVQANTDYRRIDDGNVLNATADLHANDATTAQNSNFVNQALSGDSRVDWQAGFQFLGPGTDSNSPVGGSGGKLDFSDTVELLHILQVPTEQVSDWNDFAREYF